MSPDLYADLASFAALPRLTGLALSVDGSRLVASVQAPDAAGGRYASALWEIGLDGSEPVRLTHSDKGESGPAFHPDGSLLFVSARPGTDGETSEDSALWRLPPRGEATVHAEAPGGLSGLVVAAGSGAVLAAGSRLAGTPVDGDDAERRKARKDRKVNAILHTGMPIRHWDHELGESSTRLLAVDADGAQRDICPDAGFELDEATYTVSADGSWIATTWAVRRSHGRRPGAVAVIDAGTGRRVVLAQPTEWHYLQPVISPDGAWVALVQEQEATFEAPPASSLVIVSVSAAAEPVTPVLGDLYPTEWAWSADSSHLYVAGDLHGRGAVFSVELATGTVVRLAQDAAYASLCADPSGRYVYALRSTIDTPPTPVRIDTGQVDQTPQALRSPGELPAAPGTLTELVATGPDGANVHAWLAEPAPGDGPAPVMLWIHGGPFGSWNAWSWRWNPWVAVAHGWAVVMPDPALSTGYGDAWFDRAWPYEAAEVFADCEAVLDLALQRPGLDASRVACLGASFGGYMTNWVAGHTDRFGAIVTHAGLWALDQQHMTTDAAWYKTGIFSVPADHPEWYERNSPHHSADAITTPMLVVHGSRDYRVPVSEALRLWWDLCRRHDGPPEELRHRFLQLTGENHWVLSPANAEIWYSTVLGFCAQHVLGQQFTPPPLL